MSNKDLNIKRYIYMLTIVLFSGILLFMSSHFVFHFLLDKLDNEKTNVHNRYEISEVIIDNINFIEKDYYNIFVVKAGVFKQTIVERTKKYFNTIYKAIDVLENGGVLSVNVNLNLGDKSEFTEFIEYYPTDNSIVLEAVEIKPKLVEIHSLLSEINILTNARDEIIENQREVEELIKIKNEIFNFSRKTNSYFYRLRENANRAFYNGTVKLEKIDKEIESSREYYGWIEKIFLLIISVIMIGFSSVIIKQINKINAQLISAKQEIRTSMEELEQTNAHLTQEIAEKRLAEETLKITEHRLVTMWNSVHSGVLLVRKDNGSIVDSNPSAERMLGIAKESIIGNSCHNFIINSDGAECAFSQVNLDKDYHPDCFLIAANGKTIPILKTEVELELNATKFWLVSFTDVTILKEAEKALVHSKEQAENADKLKSIFLAQMSHEIRTPINVMLSVSSLLQLEVGDKLDKEQLSYFNLISKSGNRITRTVDLLINLSEIQAGTYEPIIKRFDLYSEVLSKLLLEYKKRGMEKDISLVINFNAENSYLYGDIYTIEQIFRQLFDNAVIFTETGKISVSIFQNNHDKLVVEIQDTGVGISPKYMKEIFSPFTQEEMGYTRKFDGNGIGLSLVKSYCDLNKAIIEVESEKGIGSTFRVIFS